MTMKTEEPNTVFEHAFAGPKDLFTDTAAILDSIVSGIYYGMLRGQIHTNLPPEHPIITIWNDRIQNGRRIGKKVYSARVQGLQKNKHVGNRVIILFTRHPHYLCYFSL